MVFKRLALLIILKKWGNMDPATTNHSSSHSAGDWHGYKADDRVNPFLKQTPVQQKDGKQKTFEHKIFVIGKNNPSTAAPSLNADPSRLPELLPKAESAGKNIFVVLNTEVQIENKLKSFFYHLYAESIANPTVLKILVAVGDFFGRNMSSVEKVVFGYKTDPQLNVQMEEAQANTTVFRYGDAKTKELVIKKREAADPLAPKLETKVVVTNKIDSIGVANDLIASIASAKGISEEDAAKLVGIMNFANSVHVGGAFSLGGAGSQEEDILRKIYLFASLNPVLNGHLREQLREGPQNKVPMHIPVTGLVLSEGVPQIADEKGHSGPPLNIISLAATDMRNTSMETESIRKVMEKYGNVLPGDKAGMDAFAKDVVKELNLMKLREVFLVAEAKGYKHIVAGKLGCGAFGNDPKMIADCFNIVMKEFNGKFESVIFPIGITEYEKLQLQYHKNTNDEIANKNASNAPGVSFSEKLKLAREREQILKAKVEIEKRADSALKDINFARAMTGQAPYDPRNPRN